MITRTITRWACCCWSWSPLTTSEIARLLDPMLRVLRRRFPLVELISADGGYPGPAVAWARDKLQLTVQIVKRCDDVGGSRVLLRTVGRRAHLRMDHAPEKLHPRLRTPRRPPRSHSHLGHDYSDLAKAIRLPTRS